MWGGKKGFGTITTPVRAAKEGEEFAKTQVQGPTECINQVAVYDQENNSAMKSARKCQNSTVEVSKNEAGKLQINFSSEKMKRSNKPCFDTNCMRALQVGNSYL